MINYVLIHHFSPLGAHMISLNLILLFTSSIFLFFHKKSLKITLYLIFPIFWGIHNLYFQSLVWYLLEKNHWSIIFGKIYVLSLKSFTLSKYISLFLFFSEITCFLVSFLSELTQNNGELNQSTSPYSVFLN